MEEGQADELLKAMNYMVSALERIDNRLEDIHKRLEIIDGSLDFSALDGIANIMDYQNTHLSQIEKSIDDSVDQLRDIVDAIRGIQR